MVDKSLSELGNGEHALISRAPPDRFHGLSSMQYLAYSSIKWYSHSISRVENSRIWSALVRWPEERLDGPLPVVARDIAFDRRIALFMSACLLV